MQFLDRADAGRKLAELLLGYRSEEPIVLALPRGGVAVAFEVARALRAPLDVCVVRKIGVPGQPELAMGAIAEGGAVVLDPKLMRRVGVSQEEVAALVERKAAEVEERVALFRGARPPLDLHGRMVLLVDDGIATGNTMLASIKSVRARGPRTLVLAVPIAATQAVEQMTPLVDEVVCFEESEALGAIGYFYEDFTQVSDTQVIQLLERSRAWLGQAYDERAPPSPS